jgi:CheY-like chemotaxis protein
MNNPENLGPFSTDQVVVLVAEDEVLVRNIARIVLESEGYLTLTASDGLQALELARKFSGTIHALLTDVKMPNMDGLQLREKILNERPGIKVLVMSGQIESLSEDIPFVRKPFGPTVLKQRMRQLLQ